MIRKLIAINYLKTGNLITHKELAEELCAAGFFSTINSAQNAISRLNRRRYRHVDIALMAWLAERFCLTVDELIATYEEQPGK